MPNPYDPQNINGLNPNPLSDEKKSDASEIENILKESDKKYITYLRTRLENAKTQRDLPYAQFGNKTYKEYYEANEKIANTYQLDPKKNEDDVQVSSGTIEAKLDALLSHINNLNLKAEISAFDKDNNEIVELGVALQDIIHDTEIRDGADNAGDEDKIILRQRELLKQGTVFVQEEWLRKFETKKKLKEKFNGNFSDFKGYTESLELVFEGPSRTLLYGPNVYLGDITAFYMDEQPYIFALIHMDYEEAKSKYGKFEMFKFVKKGKVPNSATAQSSQTIFNNAWRLTEVKDNQVEVILYQDKFNDEFNIMINGIPMLPSGFPLSAVTPDGNYNIAKQVYRVLDAKFAYGGSFVASGSIQKVSEIIDEMLKLFVLKTRKSITPAYINTSGRVINKKVLSPGRISMGIDPSSLVPVSGNEVQGVTAGEYGFLEKLQSLVDKSTVSEQFTGQQAAGSQTATETLELRERAQLTLSLTLASCMLLEKKLAHLRLYNIINNWFEPVGEKAAHVEDVRSIVKKYRKVVRNDADIPGEGTGQRNILLQDGQLPDENVIRQLELDQEKSKGKPVRMIFINPTEVKNAKLFWYVNIVSKARESSPWFKMMFKEMLADVAQMQVFGSVPNREGLEEQFAQIYGKPRNKFFASVQATPDMAGVGGASPGQQPGVARAPGRPNTPGMPVMPGNMM